MLFIEQGMFLVNEILMDFFCMFMFVGSSESQTIIFVIVKRFIKTK